jgi:cell division septation protein DedD
VIFLCGVMVGRDVQKQRVAMAAAAAATATPADPTADVRAPLTSESGAAPPSAAPGEEALTYPDRLEGRNAPPETLKAAPPPVQPAAAPPPPPRASAPAPSEPAAAGRDATGPGFAVQVAAVGERGEADVIAQRLSRKGYPAYVMAPAANTPRVFRVRVGKFKDRREAEQVAARLQREEQFKPWITR